MVRAVRDTRRLAEEVMNATGCLVRPRPAIQTSCNVSLFSSSFRVGMISGIFLTKTIYNYYVLRYVGKTKIVISVLLHMQFLYRLMCFHINSGHCVEIFDKT